jgi:hypothetical protein
MRPPPRRTWRRGQAGPLRRRAADVFARRPCQCAKGRRPVGVVPQAALIADQEGIYVFIEDGKAAVRRVKTGGESGANIVVLEGLKGGEQIIVEGLQSVRAGQDVMATPLPVALNRS